MTGNRSWRAAGVSRSGPAVSQSRTGLRRPLAVLLVALAGCGPAPTAPTSSAPKPLPTAVVTVAPVTARTVARSVAAVGTLSGFEEATLAPKVDGRVLAVHADAGDWVLPGQPLLDLDPTDFRLDVDRARRALALELSKADLTAMPPESTPFDPERVPSVRRATLLLENAKRDSDRVEKMGSTSDRERATALTDFKVAEATRRQAVSEVRAVIAAARLRQVELEQAEQRLADATLSAPVPAGWSPGRRPSARRPCRCGTRSPSGCSPRARWCGPCRSPTPSSWCWPTPSS